MKQTPFIAASKCGRYTRSMRVYTMVELVVCMAIFSILTLILMRFFTSAQGAWTSSERRTQTYADSRIAFDMIANAAKSAPRSDLALSTGQIVCPTVFPNGDVGTFDLRFNSVDGTLEIRQPGKNNAAAAYQTVLENVTDFTISGYTDSWGATTAPAQMKFLFVTLEMLSPTDFARYQAASGDDAKNAVRNEKGFRFIRIIDLP